MSDVSLSALTHLGDLATDEFLPVYIDGKRAVKCELRDDGVYLTTDQEKPVTSWPKVRKWLKETGWPEKLQREVLRAIEAHESRGISEPTDFFSLDNGKTVNFEWWVTTCTQRIVIRPDVIL